MEAKRRPEPSLDALTAASRFAALGHEARVEVLRMLIRSHPDGMVVGDIQEALGLPGSTLSHHLDTLRREGLVVYQRESRNLRYFARLAELDELQRYLYEECCRGALPGAC